MAKMSNYCKAYYVRKFRAFPDWKEEVKNLRSDKNGGSPKTALADEDILYLHENYTVTDGVFQDENIIFNQPTDAWKEFCHKVLEFSVPVRNPPPVQT